MAARFWHGRILRQLARRTRATRALSAPMLVLSYAMFSPAQAQTPTAPPLPRFDLTLTTTRGCLETGQVPVYVVGESITVGFRIGSDTVPQATATLFDILADGNVAVFAFGRVPTNQTFVIGARIAPPLGVEQLRLKASAPGVLTTRRSCSFVVVEAPTPAATTTASASPTPTTAGSPPPPAETATATPTPAASVTATATAAALSPVIRTNRGCLENKDNAVFALGEAVRVSFRIDSQSLPFASAALLDTLPNGLVNLFSFGIVPTNITFAFSGRIAPPTGVESLQLRARASGIQVASMTCSFLVVAFPGAPTAGTGGPATATPTATSTPTPASGNETLSCAGACTQAGVVTITDVLAVVSVAAGDQDLSTCPAADTDGDGQVTVDEVLAAVKNAVDGCNNTTASPG